MKKFHESLAAARYASHLSLTDLCKVTGLSTSTLSNIETGKMVEPSFYKIAKIAAAIGLSLDDLAKTEMKSWCSPALRKRRARIASDNWSDPNTSKKMTAGQRKGAKTLNKKLTPEWRLQIAERKKSNREIRLLSSTIRQD